MTLDMVTDMDITQAWSSVSIAAATIRATVKSHGSISSANGYS